MDSLSSARAFIGDSLAFHIIFALFGVGLPWILMCIEMLAVRYHDETLHHIADKIYRVMVLLITVGVVSGTLIAIQMATIWPGLIDFGDEIIGLPFMLEGYAFLFEVIFLAMYAATRKTWIGYRHALILAPVGLGAVLSAVCITVANAWMNVPGGFELVNGTMTNINIVQGLLTPTAFFEVTHSVLAYILAAALSVLAGVLWYAWKNHSRITGSVPFRHMVSLLLGIVIFSEIALGIVGDMSLRYLSVSEPKKFAAIELVESTGGNQPFRIGGQYNQETGKVEGAFEVENMLSFMTGATPTHHIMGLNDVAAHERPMLIVHTLFEVKMVMTIALVLTTVVYAWLHRKKSLKLYTKAGAVIMTILAGASILIIELGWMVTELGRQPYAVMGYLKTADAFVNNPDVVRWGIIFPITFVVLCIVTIIGLRKIIRSK